MSAAVDAPQTKLLASALSKPTRMASTEPLLDADPDPEIFDCEQLPVTLDPESRSQSAAEHHHVYHALGSKQLGTMLSIMFIVNQIYGPGVLAIPLVYQQAGVVSTLIMLAFFFIASCFSSTMLVAAMTAIPGNSKFEKRMEFGSVVGHYYGPRWKVAFDILLNLTLQAYNIASIVICAQSIDQFVIYVGGHTYALEFWPSFGFHSFSDITVLYSSAVLTMSLGYIIIMLMCIPMSMLNLDDNVKVVQTASFVFLAVLCVEFCAYFIYRAADGDWHGLPAFGSNNTQLVSVFIFSWAFTMFIPSWVNEKKDDVSVNYCVWTSGIASFFGYVFIGLLCACTYGHLALDNMLVRLSLPPTPLITMLCAYAFSLGVIAPGIPVCSITTRYNLYVGRVCGKTMSYFWGVFAPWLVACLFCQGAGFAQLLNWSSLLFNGATNFMIPMWLYYVSIKRKGRGYVPDSATLHLNSDEAVMSPSANDAQPAAPLSDVSDEGEQQGEPFQVFPDFLGWVTDEQKSKATLTLLIVTSVIVTTQIVADFYYLIVLGENILDN